MRLDELLGIISEYENGWTIGPSMGMGPDTTGFSGKGNRLNFEPMTGSVEPDLDNRAQGSFDRGTMNRPDVSGGPREPSQRYTDTWDTEIYEASGTPMNFGMSNRAGNMSGATIPGASGGSWSKAAFAADDEDLEKIPESVEMEENENEEQPQEQTGWQEPEESSEEEAEEESHLEHEKQETPEEERMEHEDEDRRNLGAWMQAYQQAQGTGQHATNFDPSPVNAEPVQNPMSDYLGDQTDDSLEPGIKMSDISPSSDPSQSMADIQDLVVQIMTLPKPGWGELGQMTKPPELVSKGQNGGEMVSKAQAWDVLQKVISNMDGQLKDGLAEGDVIKFPKDRTTQGQDLGRNAVVKKLDMARDDSDFIDASSRRAMNKVNDLDIADMKGQLIVMMTKDLEPDEREEVKCLLNKHYSIFEFTHDVRMPSNRIFRKGQKMLGTWEFNGVRIWSPIPGSSQTCIVDHAAVEELEDD
jgi:hypothetical protein